MKRVEFRPNWLASHPSPQVDRATRMMKEIFNDHGKRSHAAKLAGTGMHGRSQLVIPHDHPIVSGDKEASKPMLNQQQPA